MEASYCLLQMFRFDATSQIRFNILLSCCKFCELWFIFRPVFFLDLILYGCLWMDSISDGLYMRAIHRVVGQAVVWLTEHNRTNPQALHWVSSQWEIRREIKSGLMSFGRREGEMRRHWPSLIFFFPHTNTHTHTHQDLYSNSLLGPERAWDCFTEDCLSFIAPSKPLAWPKGGYGYFLPLKPSAADHFHYSIKPLA